MSSQTNMPCVNCICYALCNAKVKKLYKVYKTHYLIRVVEECELFMKWLSGGIPVYASKIPHEQIETFCKVYNIEMDMKPDINLKRHFNPCGNCLTKVQCKDRLIHDSKYKGGQTMQFPADMSPIRYILYRAFNDTLRTTCWRVNGFIDEYVRLVEPLTDDHAQQIIAKEIIRCFDLELRDSGFYE